MNFKEIKITTESKVKGILRQLLINRTGAVIWQNEGELFERLANKGNMIKFSEDEEHLYLAPQRDPFKFHIDEPLYFLNEAKNILFKTEIYHHSPYKLKLITPTSLVIRDHRKDPRQNLIYKNINIAYHFGGIGAAKFPYTSQLLDFSARGLSFKSNLSIVKQLTRGDRMAIKFPDQQRQTIEAQVCYVTKYQQEHNAQSCYKVGVSFH